jgi:hypothetical protein
MMSMLVLQLPLYVSDWAFTRSISAGYREVAVCNILAAPCPGKIW